MAEEKDKAYNLDEYHGRSLFSMATEGFAAYAAAAAALVAAGGAAWMFKANKKTGEAIKKLPDTFRTMANVPAALRQRYTGQAGNILEKAEPAASEALALIKNTFNEIQSNEAHKGIRTALSEARDIDVLRKAVEGNIKNNTILSEHANRLLDGLEAMVSNGQSGTEFKPEFLPHAIEALERTRDAGKILNNTLWYALPIGTAVGGGIGIGLAIDEGVENRKRYKEIIKEQRTLKEQVNSLTGKNNKPLEPKNFLGGVNYLDTLQTQRTDPEQAQIPGLLRS